MADAWQAPDSCGVKLTDFDHLTAAYATLGPRLDHLSHELAAALTQAGVDTSPAAVIQRIATWTRDIAPDLRRRAQLVHDMDKNGDAFTIDIPGGATVVLLPDRFQDQQAELEGKEAARLLPQAATGDRKALATLASGVYDPTNAHFTQPLITALGPTRLLQLPAGLAYQLRLLERQEVPHQIPAFTAAKDRVQRVLRLLADTIAAAADARSGTWGSYFLKELQTAGRTKFLVPGAGPGLPVPGISPDPNHVYGYQALATLLGQASPGEQFSTRFFQTVGADMIAFDRTIPQYDPTTLPDLAGHENLGMGLLTRNQMQPIPFDGRSDFLLPLLQAAQTPAAARALLEAAPPGKSTDLHYLLIERASRWGLTDKGTALGGLLTRSLSDTTADSDQLFDKVVQTLGPNIRTWLTSDGAHLTVTNPAYLNDMSELRPAVADILTSRLTTINPELAGAVALGGVNPTITKLEHDLAALIAFATSDDQSFWTLVQAQLGHTKAWLDHQLTTGHGTTEGLTQAAINISFILTLRRAMMEALQPKAEDNQNQFLKQLVEQGIGYIPVPYANLIGETAAPAIETLIRTTTYTKIGTWLINKATEIPQTPDNAAIALSDQQTVLKLIKQMIAGATILHLKYSPADLAHRSFVGDGRILTPEGWNSRQLQEFMNWSMEQPLPTAKMGDDMMSTINNTSSEALGLFNVTQGTKEP